MFSEDCRRLSDRVVDGVIIALTIKRVRAPLLFSFYASSNDLVVGFQVYYRIMKVVLVHEKQSGAFSS